MARVDKKTSPKMYCSKVDGGYKVIMCIAILVVIAQSCLPGLHIIGAITALLVIWLCYKCSYGLRYWIDGDKLFIKGLTKTSIDIQAIRQIKRCNNCLASAASSFQRLEIKYKKYDTVYISPKDERGLIQSLLVINPNIKVIDGVIR